MCVYLRVYLHEYLCFPFVFVLVCVCMRACVCVLACVEQVTVLTRMREQVQFGSDTWLKPATVQSRCSWDP